MYPQSKFSGYERGNAQAWQPAQPWPQQPAGHPAWPQPQGEVQWPPPSLNPAPQFEGFSAYQPASRAYAWKAKLFIFTAVFGAGAYARPFIESRIADLPGDALVVASFARSRIPSWVPYVGGPMETNRTNISEAPHAGIVTSPLPTPRMAAPATPPKPAEAPPAPAVVAKDVSPVVEAPPEVVAEDRPARHSSGSKRYSTKLATRHKRLAMRASAPKETSAAKSPSHDTAPRVQEAPEPAVAAAAPQAPKEPAPPADPLEGLLRRAVSSSAPLAAKNGNATNRMRFPDEKAPAVRAPQAALPAPKPESITGDVTSAAEAAAKASAAAATSTPSARAAALPKMPGKVRLSDDPLEGLSGKEIEGKRQGKAKPARRS